MVFGVGFKCRFFVFPSLFVNFSRINFFGEGRAVFLLSYYYSYFRYFCSKGIIFLWVLGKGCVIFILVLPGHSILLYCSGLNNYTEGSGSATIK